MDRENSIAVSERERINIKIRHKFGVFFSKRLYSNKEMDLNDSYKLFKCEKQFKKKYCDKATNDCETVIFYSVISIFFLTLL